MEHEVISPFFFMILATLWSFIMLLKDSSHSEEIIVFIF